MRRILRLLLVLSMMLSTLTIPAVQATSNQSSSYHGVHVEESAEDTIVSEESYNTTLTSATEKTGLYKDQYTSGILSYSYEALENTEITPKDNGVTIIYVYQDGETEESCEQEVLANYFSLLYGYKYDHLDEFNWSTNEAGITGYSFGEDSCTFTLYYPVSDYYTSSTDAQVEEVVNQAISSITGTSRYDQLKSIYKWLCEYTTYDWADASGKDVGEEQHFYSHSHLGVLLHQLGVCESYSKAFKLICLKLDIPCLLITNDNHMWNYVMMEDGKWYMVDVTFGDQGYVDYNWFLISNTPYDSSHIPDDFFIYPETSYISYLARQGHNYTENVTKEATCEEAGSVTLTCSECGNVITKSLTAFGHKWEFTSSIVNSDSSITKVYTCKRCGETKTETTATCEEHNWENKGLEWADDNLSVTATFQCSICGEVKTFTSLTTPDISKEPTCTTGGYGTYSVELVCTLVVYDNDTGIKTEKHIIKTSKSDYIHALGHNYELQSTVEPTYTKEGSNTYVCSRCGNSYSEVIDKIPHTHDIVIDKAIAAACTTTGLTEGTHCSICGEVFTAQTTTSALGHNYTSKVTTEATCTAEGVRTYTCTRCGDSYTETITPTAHQFIQDAAVEATCTATGLTEGSHCLVCGLVNKIQQTTPALGHNYESKITKEATETAEGIRTYTCTRCGDSYTEVIAKKSHTHTIVTDKAVAATCTTTGLTEGSHCSACGEVIVAQKTIAALGHNYTSKVTTEATAISEGLRTYICTRCGDSYTEIIPIVSHEHEYVENVVDPTYDSQGYTLHICTICGDTYIDSYTDFSLPFIDVPQKWYYSWICKAYGYKLMTGKTDTTFDPLANMNRGQVAVVLYRMDSSPDVEYKGTFKDVANGKYYANAVEWAAENGIVTGYTVDQTFRPGNEITRQDFVLMLYRYAKYAGADVSAQSDLSSFPDVSNVSGYAREAMQWAVASGIISGKQVNGQTCLAPKATATRAECCKMLVVAYEMLNY